MKAFSNRVVGGIYKALSGLSYKIELPGLRLSEIERSNQWLRISGLSFTAPQRGEVRDGLLQVSCFNKDGTNLYKHMLMADEVINALGKSILLYADNGTSVVGVLVFKEPSVKPLTDDKGVAMAVVDYQVYYEATS